MMLSMAVLCLIVLLLLVIIAGVAPAHTTVSIFELERRKSLGDKTASAALRREMLLSTIVAMQRACTAVLLTLLVVLLILTFGWVWGLVLAVLIALEHNSVSRLKIIARRSQRLYETYEKQLLTFAEKYARGAFRLVIYAQGQSQPSVRLHSREELEDLIKRSGDVLSKNEKRLLQHGLAFESRQIHEIMTPRNKIDSIGKKELLGPLVLDDLHKTGHGRFPVTDGDIDHIIGILHINRLLSLDVKRSITAEKAMEARVSYVREDHTLLMVLTMFIRTHHTICIVINEAQETVGIVGLEDVLEALLGRKLIDEFDAYDTIRLVASRNSHDVA